MKSDAATKWRGNCVCQFLPKVEIIKNAGFLEREIKKEEIMMLDTGENPDAPLPREMIDLEVRFFYF